MDNDNFEKRMGFLKKSYERIPTSFDPDEVLQKIDEEGTIRSVEKKITTKQGTRQRITVWAASIASVFVIGLIGAGYIYDQKQPAEETIIDSEELDEYIEELKGKYEVEKEKRREMLKMDEEHFEQYIGSSSITLFSMDSYKENIKQYVNAKDILLDQYNRAVEHLKPPSEMIQDLKQNPLTEDEQRSIEFLAAYRDKVKRLNFVYGTINSQHYDAIREFEVSPSVDKAEIVMHTSKGFPEQLQNMINTMKEQSIRLETDKYIGEIGPRYYDSQLHRVLNPNLHDHTHGYRQMLIDEPYMFGGILQHSLLQSSSMLQGMEYTLMQVEQDSSLYPILKSYYIRLFNEIMLGSESTILFDADGVLLPEYQEAWKILTAGWQATPMRYLVEPIINEMEASGWRESASWEALDYNDLEEALLLYREGWLEEHIYGERPDFQDITIQLPNDSFDKEVEALYADFKKSYDKNMLKGASPIHVLAVFDYANEMDDPETMYYLYSENALYDHSGIDYTLDYYVENWRKGLSFFRNATEVNFHKESVYRNEFTFNSTVEFPEVNRAIPMVYNEEGIWEVGATRMQILPSYHESPARGFKADLLDIGSYYYKGFKNGSDLTGSYFQPLEVLGSYFYAGEIGDYATQYEMFYQGEGTDIVSKEDYLEDPQKYFFPYSEAMYKKASFQGQEQDENGNWPGVATLTVDTELYPELPPERKFHMYWTEDGWRVKFNPFE